MFGLADFIVDVRLPLIIQLSSRPTRLSIVPLTIVHSLGGYLGCVAKLAKTSRLTPDLVATADWCRRRRLMLFPASVRDSVLFVVVVIRN